MALLPSKCYTDKDIVPTGIVIHYVSARYTFPEDPFSLIEIMEILKEYRASYHVYIGRLGERFQFVEFPLKAHHAGKSRMNGKNWCNNFTIGICLAGGHGYEYTDDQYAMLAQECAKLMTEYNIPLKNIQGHDAVRDAWNTKYPNDQGASKHDPGPQFDWDRLKSSLQQVEGGF